MDDATESDVLVQAASILVRVSTRSLRQTGDDIGRLQSTIQHSLSEISPLAVTILVGLFLLGLIALAGRDERVQNAVIHLSRGLCKCARKVRVVLTRMVIVVVSGPVGKANFNSLKGSGSTWDCKSDSGKAACYALQGRRPKMEDRFTLIEGLATTPLHLFAVYDGHGGEFAADYVQRWIVNWLEKRAVNYKNIPAPHSGVQEIPITDPEPSTADESVVLQDDSSSPPAASTSTNEQTAPNAVSKKPRPNSSSSIHQQQQPQQLEGGQEPKAGEGKNVLRRSSAGKEINSATRAVMQRTVSRQSSGGSVRSVASATPREKKHFSAFASANEFDLSHELKTAILESDKALIQAAKKANDVAGSTALVALLDTGRRQLTVANVGDSRGILCDIKGTVIPLSFDHKPQQLKERKRIQEAGGFISFNGVWRVAGILATSRALGDFPLKDRKLLIAEPDILSFDLQDLRLQKPSFLILASDGLWDAFSNEEAAFYVRQRLHEPHLGARSLAMQAYQRGSVDNITVLVVNLSNL